MRRILEKINPELVYFTERNGQRGGILIIDLIDPSNVPALAEPWFLNFNVWEKVVLISGGAYPHMFIDWG